MKKITSVSLALALSLAVVSPVAAFNMGSITSTAGSVAGSALSDNALISSLTGLGVSPTQALGGTAAIMNKVKESVGSEAFEQIVSKVPGLDSVLDNAAATTKTSGGSLTDQFKSLGMNSDMVQKFTPIVENYLGKYISADNLALVKKALA